MTPDPITPERRCTCAEDGSAFRCGIHTQADFDSARATPGRLRAAQADAWDECAWQAWGLDESLWPFRNPYRVQSEGGGDE